MSKDNMFIVIADDYIIRDSSFSKVIYEYRLCVRLNTIIIVYFMKLFMIAIMNRSPNRGL